LLDNVLLKVVGWGDGLLGFVNSAPTYDNNAFLSMARYIIFGAKKTLPRQGFKLLSYKTND